MTQFCSIVFGEELQHFTEIPIVTQFWITKNVSLRECLLYVLVKWVKDQNGICWLYTYLRARSQTAGARDHCLIIKFARWRCADRVLKFVRVYKAAQVQSLFIRLEFWNRARLSTRSRVREWPLFINLRVTGHLDLQWRACGQRHVRARE